jgi:hypothetical protein
MAVNRIEAEVIQNENFTEAQIKGAGTPVVLKGETFVAVDTGNIIYRKATNGDDDDWESWPQDAADPTKRSIIHGFVDPDSISFTFVDSTRVLTCTSTNPTVDFWSGGTFYSLTAGNPLLSVTVPNTAQWNYTSFNTSGQLIAEDFLNWTSVDTNCLGELINFDPLDTTTEPTGSEISRICRLEDCEANHIENFASYKTKGIVATTNRVTFDAAIGDLTTGFSSGDYFTSRDYEFLVASRTVTNAVYPIFYFDGLSGGKNYTKRKLHLPPSAEPFARWDEFGGGTTNIAYNNWTGTEFEVLECPSNQYAIGMMVVAPNPTVQITALMPQGTYNTEANARDSIEDAVNNVVVNNDVFRDATIIGAFIVKGNLVGGFLDATGSGDAFWVPTGGVSGGGVSSGTVPTFDEVLNSGPRATVFPYLDKTAAEIAAEAASDDAVLINERRLQQATVFLAQKSGANLDTIELGDFYSTATTGMPAGANDSGFVKTKDRAVGGGLIKRQTWEPYNSNDLWIRHKPNTAAWSAWEKVALDRADAAGWTQLGASGVYYCRKNGIAFYRLSNVTSSNYSTPTLLGIAPAGYRSSVVGGSLANTYPTVNNNGEQADFLIDVTNSYGGGAYGVYLMHTVTPTQSFYNDSISFPAEV